MAAVAVGVVAALLTACGSVAHESKEAGTPFPGGVNPNDLCTIVRVEDFAILFPGAEATPVKTGQYVTQSCTYSVDLPMGDKRLPVTVSLSGPVNDPKDIFRSIDRELPGTGAPANFLQNSNSELWIRVGPKYYILGVSRTLDNDGIECTNDKPECDMPMDDVFTKIATELVKRLDLAGKQGP